ncbi:hypothetical protein [Amycolatopsis sp. NPDC051061]|uniref:hypothetical protein n=1 Tax=Amycolatopsis sp. NPDC051061 TaxID=3155042 RepID=UPI00342D9269
MAIDDAGGPAPRTALEQKIRERRQTLAEFAHAAEEFARSFGEPGTLSERHLKRLVAGSRPDGSPVGRPRPATARLLERMLGLTIDELLARPDTALVVEPGEHELRQRLSAARRVNPEVLALLQSQLTAVRRLDRQLGAATAHDEVTTKISQVNRLRAHSLTPSVRGQLAALLAEFGTLAGWQALDMGSLARSWQLYEQAKAAASETDDAVFGMHCTAEQAFVLIEIGETAAAAELLSATERKAQQTAGRLLRSWLAAASGEALAADGQRSASLRAFDRAAALLPSTAAAANEPYVALDSAHLARWRGHALARVGESGAVEVLLSALDQLDPTFIRAETGLRVDLASALFAIGDREQGRTHARKALALAKEIGSVRQQQRIARLDHRRPEHGQLAL